jgi:hypothetical protein
MSGDKSNNNLYTSCCHGHVYRFKAMAMEKEFVTNALQSKGYEVEVYEHNSGDGRWHVGNGDFEVRHCGQWIYSNTGWSRKGTVDTIIQGRSGWKRKAIDLNGVAQILQTAYYMQLSPNAQ